MALFGTILPELWIVTVILLMVPFFSLSLASNPVTWYHDLNDRFLVRAVLANLASSRACGRKFTNVAKLLFRFTIGLYPITTSDHGLEVLDFKLALSIGAGTRWVT